MIAPSTSSGEEQLALTGDRIESLKESQIIKTSSGIPILDKMRFFCRNKPAQQLEHGTQIGGVYKCGLCGCADTMMQDLAYAFHCKPRSLEHLQSLVLTGKFGNQPGHLDNLLVEQL